ncbi:hypothetical protein F8M41_026518 [Gigaspora margarita]|uniref:Uncharacterized protein n=1 Tax=Gigaspora margarita TaxID=4874 RepID=A0A8H3XHC5_GIGMA|nr:hypothetical protein F8M41_026518 [Gigaspora margarita]
MTEPKSLYILNIFLLILLLISLLGYTLLVILDIFNDNPIIQNSLVEENSIPVPAVSMSSTLQHQQIGISCRFVNACRVHDCNQYISYNNSNRNFLSVFLAKDLIFSSIPNNGINSLEFKIYLNDTRYNLSDHLTILGFFFNMQDQDSDKFFEVFELPTYLMFPLTMVSLNDYILATYSSYKIKIKRRRKEILLPRLESILGFPSKLESMPHITSTLAQVFVVQIETDKRTKTVLNSLGLIGGAWGFAKTIYTILFGATALKPWGLIQKYGFKINNSVSTEIETYFGTYSTSSLFRNF